MIGKHDYPVVNRINDTCRSDAQCLVLTRINKKGDDVFQAKENTVLAKKKRPSANVSFEE